MGIQHIQNLTKTLKIPASILKALRAGADFAISFSGGKDSHAMLMLLANHPDRVNWSGKFYALHADLGAAEWKETKGFCEQVCAGLGVELVVVKRTDGRDLIDYITDKVDDYAGTGKPVFPSSTIRYCTSDLKREPLNKNMRQSPFIVSAEGVRADESPKRAKKPMVEVRKSLAGKVYGDMGVVKMTNSHLKAVAAADGKRVPRAAYDYRPVFKFTESDVWEAIGTSKAELTQRQGMYAMALEMRVAMEIDLETFEQLKAAALDGWVGHPAYVYGNDRLSCSLCVLANNKDLLNGAVHNPEAFERFKQIELDSGTTFKNGWSITELEADMKAILKATTPPVAVELPMAS